MSKREEKPVEATKRVAEQASVVKVQHKNL